MEDGGVAQEAVHFVAEHLAYLLVLWRQVEKEKEAQ
jgi:hypothetical protein